MPKGFKHWENDPALVGVYGIALHKIKDPIRLRIILVVEPVQIHQRDQGYTCLITFRKVSFFSTSRLLIQDVKLEVLPFELA